MQTIYLAGKNTDYWKETVSDRLENRGDVIYFSEDITETPFSFDNSDFVVINTLGQSGLTIKDMFFIYICKQYNKDLILITTEDYPVDRNFVTLLPTIESVIIYLGTDSVCYAKP